MTQSTNRYSLYFGSGWTTICEGIADYSAESAAVWFFEYDAFLNKLILEDDFDIVASYTMDSSQQNMAAFLYKFLEEVGEV